MAAQHSHRCKQHVLHGCLLACLQETAPEAVCVNFAAFPYLPMPAQLSLWITNSRPQCVDI
jgi:hypothetical protein